MTRWISRPRVFGWFHVVATAVVAIAARVVDVDVDVDVNVNFGVPTADWEEFSDRLGEGVLRTIGPVDKVFDECATSIRAYGGALLPSIANGTCVFAAECVYRNCTRHRHRHHNHNNQNSRNHNHNLPRYSVVATTLYHVQETVRFAALHKIPLSIKSTGASYSVADQLNDNLLLSMSNFPKHSRSHDHSHWKGNGIDEADLERTLQERRKKKETATKTASLSTITVSGGVLENYTDPCGNQHGPVIEIGGGETWGGVFSTLTTYNDNVNVSEGGSPQYMLSSGAAVTVGASGGWLMGGGLGPFDRSMGLGIDNVIAFKVVTAPHGIVKTVYECHNENNDDNDDDDDEGSSDLFWALRGGGGGNFGVVVSQLSKLHPIQPLVRANLIWMNSPAVKAVTDHIPDGVTISGPMVPDAIAKGSIGTRQNNLVWTKPLGSSTSMSTSSSSEWDGDQLDAWWDALLTVLNPVTMDVNIDGYYGIGCAWAGGYMCADLYYQGAMDEFETIVLAPLRAILNITAMPTEANATANANGPGAAGTGPNFVYIAQQYDEGYYSYASQDCRSAISGSPQAFLCTHLDYPSVNGYDADVQVGRGSYETRLSWMIPKSLFVRSSASHDTHNNSSNNHDWTAAKALFREPLMQIAQGHILGGAVNRVAPNATATSPVMRESALEALFPLEWIQSPRSGGSIAQAVAVLNAHIPTGPIFNHDGRNLDLLERLGSPRNLTWEQLYWGSNLPRLKRVKAKYDPHTVFQCRDCLTPDPDTYT